jgi:hypothetical protein
MLRNEFYYDSGTKGAVYLDMKDRTSQGRMLIGHNLFVQNGGFFDTNVIYIRARGSPSQDVYNDIPTPDNLFCTGYHLE